MRSDSQTRFVRLSTSTQIIGMTGGGLIVGWAIIASAIILMDSLSAGGVREQAEREQRLYEERLNALSQERDARAEEAATAQERFSVALDQVSDMQMRLLYAEERRKEHETGIEVIQGSLRRTLEERDTALAEAELLRARLEQDQAQEEYERARAAEVVATLERLIAALSSTAEERDDMVRFVAEAQEEIDTLHLEADLMRDRNSRIFGQLEEAVAVSLTPLDEMFRAVGHDPERLIGQIRSTYSGQGGPLTPITFSTRGEAPDPDSLRANGVLERLDTLNLYRIAAPFAMPVKGSFRYTSGFGPRWGRMHNGSDFAAAHGSPIYSTADGVVTHAGWLSGYGRLIKIQHEFGIETRYAHLSRIRVEVGQRVSRGDRIGDMGNSGRSTGTHLHYEVRHSGTPVNPMSYIRAARDVF